MNDGARQEIGDSATQVPDGLTRGGRVGLGGGVPSADVLHRGGDFSFQPPVDDAGGGVVESCQLTVDSRQLKAVAGFASFACADSSRRSDVSVKGTKQKRVEFGRRQVAFCAGAVFGFRVEVARRDPPPPPYEGWESVASVPTPAVALPHQEGNK